MVVGVLPRSVKRAIPPAGSTDGRRGVRLALLNGFELTSEGEILSLPLGAQRLLAFSAVHDRPLLRLHVAGVLWLDSPEQRASANLRSALWRLHRLGLNLVEVTATHLWLAPEVAVDYRESVAMAHLLLDPSTDALEVDGLDAVLSSDLLPDWYDEWLLVKREQLRQLRLHALECACERLIACGRFDKAVEAGLLAVAGEPLRESAHRVLIAAYLAEGNRGEAIRQYRWYRRLVREELGVEPAPTIRDLVAKIRSDDPDLLVL